MNPLPYLRKLRAAYRKRKDDKLWRWAKDEVVSTHEAVLITTGEGAFSLVLCWGSSVELDTLAPNEQACSAHPLKDKYILITRIG